MNSKPSKHLPFGEKRESPFYGKHILSVGQFERADIEMVMEVAADMRTMVKHVGTFDLLKGKLITNLFYEPSTRTSSSFEAATKRLGGEMVKINNVNFSSVSKGETLPDTVRALASYSDAIVLRHYEKGAANIAAQYSPVPIINAGDGPGEHPTQALLDLFTIRQELGAVDGLTVTMLGDLKYGRTVHSLARLLTAYGVKLNYVSPDILKMPEKVTSEVAKAGIEQNAYDALEPVIAETDILYVTRVQKERFEDLAEYESVKNAFVISPDTLKPAKEKMAVMHPLPRVNEITMDLDADPRAAYFRQMENGMYVRMALLALVLGKA